MMTFPEKLSPLGKSCGKKLLVIGNIIRYCSNNIAHLFVETESKRGKSFCLSIIYVVHSLLCTSKMNPEPSKVEKFENLKLYSFSTSH